VPGVASIPNLSLEPLVGLIRHLQEENRNLAGQLGFVQAQLQQGHETIRMVQAPPPEPPESGDSDEMVVDTVAIIKESMPAQGRPWWKI
jgi:hypothetical protein